MAKQETKTAKVRKYMTANPNATAKQIVAATGASSAMVYNLRHKINKVERPLPLPLSSTQSVKDAHVAAPVANVVVADPVNNPSHYTDGGIETIDFIEAKGFDYHLGNAVKYISRAGKKGTNQGLEDLKKAQWYLARAIEKNKYEKNT